MTAYEMRVSDWSSNVCSSDLELGGLIVPEMFLFPLAIAAVGMVASIIGAFMVKSSGSTSVHDLGKALHRSTNHAAFITVAGVLALAYFMLEDSERSEARRIGKEGASTFRTRWTSYH